MTKIAMKTPLVEMDGDEMTRVLWKMIREELIEPFVDLKTEYYDLGLFHRDETDDQVTMDAALATRKYGVAVKCATITPNKARMDEYHLKKMYKSPNGTIRAALDGTVFRAPILAEGIEPYVRTWKKPIVMARHAYGDVYKGSELRVGPELFDDNRISFPAKASLMVEDAEGRCVTQEVHEFKAPGILQGMHNTEKSIESFARSCFSYALDQKLDLWFSAKDTISKVYDGEFRDVFDRIYEEEYKAAFEQAGLTYFYTLIDDAVARAIRSEGGFVWALKNYDGDVMSDMMATAFGSLAMMTSVLVSPDGCYEYEAAHGTVQRHYYRYQRGEKTSTNSVATIYAWAGALKKRGELDALPELIQFGEKLEQAALQTIAKGKMTGDLAAITTLPAQSVQVLDSEEFIKAIREELQAQL